jgi:hypothetical protein
MPKNYIKVDGKKIKMKTLKITEDDWTKLFDIAMAISEKKSRPIKPYLAFKVCLATAKQSMKCAEHWYSSEEDLAKYGDCPYNHDDKGEVKLN